MNEKKQKACKTCGQMFAPCATALPEAFNYKAVACSYECGMKYFAAIEESRKKKDIKPVIKSGKPKEFYPQKKKEEKVEEKDIVD